jgi:hypothetical protein
MPKRKIREYTPEELSKFTKPRQRQILKDQAERAKAISSPSSGSYDLNVQAADLYDDFLNDRTVDAKRLADITNDLWHALERGVMSQREHATSYIRLMVIKDVMDKKVKK